MAEIAANKDTFDHSNNESDSSSGRVRRPRKKTELLLQRHRDELIAMEGKITNKDSKVSPQSVITIEPESETGKTRLELGTPEKDSADVEDAVVLTGAKAAETKDKNAWLRSKYLQISDRPRRSSAIDPASLPPLQSRRDGSASLPSMWAADSMDRFRQGREWRADELSAFRTFEPKKSVAAAAATNEIPRAAYMFVPGQVTQCLGSNGGESDSNGGKPVVVMPRYTAQQRALSRAAIEKAREEYKDLCNSRKRRRMERAKRLENSLGVPVGSYEDNTMDPKLLGGGGESGGGAGSKPVVVLPRYTAQQRSLSRAAIKKARGKMDEEFEDWCNSRKPKRMKPGCPELIENPFGVPVGASEDNTIDPKLSSMPVVKCELIDFDQYAVEMAMKDFQKKNEQIVKKIMQEKVNTIAAPTRSEAFEPYQPLSLRSHQETREGAHPLLNKKGASESNIAQIDSEIKTLLEFVKGKESSDRWQKYQQLSGSNLDSRESVAMGTKKMDHQSISVKQEPVEDNELSERIRQEKQAAKKAKRPVSGKLSDIFTRKLKYVEKLASVPTKGNTKTVRRDDNAVEIISVKEAKRSSVVNVKQEAMDIVQEFSNNHQTHRDKSQTSTQCQSLVKIETFSDDFGKGSESVIELDDERPVSGFVAKKPVSGKLSDIFTRKLKYVEKLASVPTKGNMRTVRRDDNAVEIMSVKGAKRSSGVTVKQEPMDIVQEFSNNHQTHRDKSQTSTQCQSLVKIETFSDDFGKGTESAIELDDDSSSEEVEEVSMEADDTKDANEEARPVAKDQPRPSFHIRNLHFSRCDFALALPNHHRFKSKACIELDTRQNFVEAVFKVLFWSEPWISVAQRWQSVLEFMYSRRKLLEAGDVDGGGDKAWEMTIAVCRGHFKQAVARRRGCMQCSACGHVTTVEEVRALVADIKASCGFAGAAAAGSGDDALVTRTAAFHKLLGTGTGAFGAMVRGGNLCWPCLKRFHSCHVCAGSTNSTNPTHPTHPGSPHSLDSVHARMVAAGLDVGAYCFEEIPFADLRVQHRLPGRITKATQVCHRCFTAMTDDLDAHRPPTPGIGT